MKLWPTDSFEIETTMSEEEIASALRKWIEPRKTFRLSWDHAAFEGSFTNDGFKITRIIHYRNGFLPVVRGRFLAGPSGTRVKIEMRLQKFSAIFMAVWFGGVILGVAWAITVLLTRHTRFDPMLLIPPGMLVFGVALVSGGFWFEARKQKPLLIQMFKGKELLGSQ